MRKSPTERHVLTNLEIDEVKEVFRLNTKKRQSDGVDKAPAQNQAAPAPTAAAIATTVAISSLPAMFYALGFHLDGFDIKGLLQNIGIDAGVVNHNANSDIEINLSEFAQLVKPLILNRDPMEQAGLLFELFDEEEEGQISLRQLKRVAHEVGLNFSDENLCEMIKEASSDGGRELLTKVDFIRLILHESEGGCFSSSDDEEG